jgi:hypothetical protein
MAETDGTFGYGTVFSYEHLGSRIVIYSFGAGTHYSSYPFEPPRQNSQQCRSQPEIKQ